MKKGYLVTFEGGEACGKSTQIAKLMEYLKERNVDFLKSREPGGTVIGEQIREILLHSKEEISSTVEFLLYSSSRAEHVEKIVKPALEKGKLVILDRYYDSSFAYQGIAGNLELSEMEKVTNFAIQGAKPDLTFLFDISYEESMRRKNADVALKNLDRIEQKGREYHTKVREGYLFLAKREPERFVIIDASQPIEKVFEDIVIELGKRYTI